jgi:hypothetical protein
VRPSVIALVCGVLGASASIAACSEEPVVESVATESVATEPVATTSMPAGTSGDDSTTAESSTSTPTSTSTSTPTSTPQEVADLWRPVVTFTDAASVEGWSNVDDTVMGGMSASTTSWESGRLVFAGDLSLENNGGFASVRGPIDPALGAAIGEADALAIDAEGDGRTYVLQLRTADESLYISRFATEANPDPAVERHVLPLADFEPVTRFLEPAPSTPPLDATTVVQIAIYVLDAQEGRFRLAVIGVVAQ